MNRVLSVSTPLITYRTNAAIYLQSVGIGKEEMVLYGYICHCFQAVVRDRQLIPQAVNALTRPV